MSIEELYIEAIKYNHPSLILLIDFLLKEKKLIQWGDPIEILDYYFQLKYKSYVNQHLEIYKKSRSDLFIEKEKTTLSNVKSL